MFATNPRLVGKERREHTVQATPPVVARRGVAQPPGRALAAHITTQGSGGTFSNSASRATLRQRLDHEWVARLRRWRGCGPATLLGVRRCQQRCFSLSSGLQALNHVLDGAESGGLHHERMCGAAELMSNTRMHRASKQKHHLDNLVRRSLGCTECHADRRSRFNVYMKAVFSGHNHIDKQYFQKWERTAHGRTTGLLRLRKHPG